MAVVLAPPPSTARATSKGLSARRPSLRGFLAVFLPLYGISILPIFLVEIPSINDYLNHLARVSILQDEAAFRSFYEARWAPLPNLAVDAVVTALATVMPLWVAGKVFLALVFLQLALGTATLHRGLFGKWELWPCASFAFLYNRPLLTGLVGYLFGVGLCLFATAAWFALRRRRTWERLILGTALATALFFSHGMAFGIYGLIVLATELARVKAAPARERGRSLLGLLVSGVQGIPPLLIFLFLTPRAASSGIVYRGLMTRLQAFGNPVIVYDVALDLALAGLLLVAVLWGIRTRRLSASREIVWALVALSIAQLLMPNALLTVLGADRRLPIAIAMLFFAGTKLDLSGRPAKVIAGAFLVLLLLRMGGVLGAWRSGEPAYRDVRAAMSRIEPGSNVLSAFPDEAMDTFVKPSIAVYYLPVWETVAKRGFNPTLFAYPTQQPVRMTPEFERLARALSPGRMWDCHVWAAGGLSPGERSALSRYDYVVFVHNEPFALTRDEGLSLVAETPCAKLYRVAR